MSDEDSVLRVRLERRVDAMRAALLEIEQELEDADQMRFAALEAKVHDDELRKQ